MNMTVLHTAGQHIWKRIVSLGPSHYPSTRFPPGIHFRVKLASEQNIHFLYPVVFVGL